MQKTLPEILTNGGNCEFIRRLNANEIMFVIVGGAALAAHGCREWEEVDDLDIVIEPTTGNAEKLIDVLVACHIGFPHPVASLAKPGVQMPVKAFHYYLDVLTPRPGSSFDDILALSIAATLDGMAVRVAGRDDLIEMKQFAIASADAHSAKHEADLARLMGS
jgi:hypothetical protein